MASSADSLYPLIGRAVVRAVVGWVRYRYGRRILIAGTVAAVSAAAVGAAYVATRGDGDSL
jgi:hypothetical protein